MLTEPALVLLSVGMSDTKVRMRFIIEHGLRVSDKDGHIALVTINGNQVTKIWIEYNIK